MRFLWLALGLIAATLVLDSCNDAVGQQVVMPQVAVIELVFVNEDGTVDSDAFVGPPGATVDDCKKQIPEFIDAWSRDHPDAVFVEAFCDSRPDPKAVLAYHLKKGDIKPLPQAAPEQHKGAARDGSI